MICTALFIHIKNKTSQNYCQYKKENMQDIVCKAEKKICIGKHIDPEAFL